MQACIPRYSSGTSPRSQSMIGVRYLSFCSQHHADICRCRPGQVAPNRSLLTLHVSIVAGCHLVKGVLFAKVGPVAQRVRALALPAVQGPAVRADQRAADMLRDCVWQGADQRRQQKPAQAVSAAARAADGSRQAAQAGALRFEPSGASASATLHTPPFPDTQALTGKCQYKLLISLCAMPSQPFMCRECGA